jgi:hypothetical protein
VSRLLSITLQELAVGLAAHDILQPASRRYWFRRNSTLVIRALIHLGNLCDPTLALRMLHRQDFVMRPVKVICNVRYLLEEPL